MSHCCAVQDTFIEKHGVKLGFMSAFVKAAADALHLVPAVNAVIDGDEIVYRDFTDISIAVATPKGLVVPVLRNADLLGFAGVEKVGRCGRLQGCTPAAGKLAQKGMLQDYTAKSRRWWLLVVSFYLLVQLCGDLGWSHVKSDQGVCKSLTPGQATCLPRSSCVGCISGLKEAFAFCSA